MTDLVLLILIFVAAGLVVLASNLVLGRLVRPLRPNAEKSEVYECGERPMGSAWVQFDVRFYVVALLFVVFDVELAFFFPWAVVFGSASRAGDEALPEKDRIHAAKEIQPPESFAQHAVTVPKNVTAKSTPSQAPTSNAESIGSAEPKPDAEGMHKFARIAFLDLLVFFAVLLVGFAYLWRRGDLKWVRSLAGQVDWEREHYPHGTQNAERDAQNVLAS